MPASTDLPCRSLVELVTDYLEDALEPGDRRRVDAHLATCEGCTTYVEQLRLTVDAIGRLPAPVLSSGAREALHAAWAAAVRADGAPPRPAT